MTGVCVSLAGINCLTEPAAGPCLVVRFEHAESFGQYWWECQIKKIQLTSQTDIHK
jgi:hypothetical protein